MSTKLQSFRELDSQCYSDEKRERRKKLKEAAEKNKPDDYEDGHHDTLNHTYPFNKSTIPDKIQTFNTTSPAALLSARSDDSLRKSCDERR